MKVRLLSLLGLLLLGACVKNRIDNTFPQQEQHTLQSLQLFGGSEEDIAHAIIPTQDGGFAVLGNTKSTNGDIEGKNLAVSDLLLIKYAANATPEWQATYGGSEDDRGHSLIQLSDGGYALLGYSMSQDGDASINQGQHDNWVIRTDASGAILWEKSFGFSGHDHAYNIIATQDGGLLFNGFLDVTSSGGQGTSFQKARSSARHGVGEFWVHKINLEGEIEWRQYFGGTNNDRSYDAIETPAGDFIVVGTSESDDVDISSPRGGYDIWIIKLDQAGNLIWERSFGGSQYDAANAVTLDQAQNIYVLGNTFSEDHDVSSPLGHSDMWLISLNQNGELLGERSFGGSGFDMGRDLAFAPNGTLWLVGYSQSEDIDFSLNAGDNDIALLQLDQNLFPQQHFNLGGSGLDIAHAVLPLKDGRLLVVGTSESQEGLFQNNKGDKDIFVALWDVILE
ncbi:MAG: hypothetical protein ACPGC8_04475 [Flavobacteriaceae bacterium]